MVKIQNIKVGDVYKSYRQVCEVLDEKIKNGNSKKAQLAEWERYFRHSKDGNKFIIEEIYVIPLEKNETRGGANNNIDYIENIEKLILHLLTHEDNKGKVFLSRNKMFQLLRMVNDNYIIGKYKPLRLSKVSEIPKDHIIDFYQTSDGMLKRNLESALDNLRKKSLVFWSHALTVGVAKAHVDKDHHNNIIMGIEKTTDEYGDEKTEISVPQVTNTIEHRKATEKEVKKIIKAEKTIRNSMGLKTIQDVFIRNKTNEFYSKVIDYLFSPNNKNEEKIYTYYNSYEIIFNIDDVEDELKELGKLELDNLEKRKIEEILSMSIVNRAKNNGTNRHINALKNKKLNDTILMRKDLEYENNIHRLSDILISNDSPVVKLINNKLK